MLTTTNARPIVRRTLTVIGLAALASATLVLEGCHRIERRHRQWSSNEVMENFDQFDANNDGVLSKAELNEHR